MFQRYEVADEIDLGDLVSGTPGASCATKISVRSSAVFLVVLIASTALFATGSLMSASDGRSSTVPTHVCDAALSAELGLSATNLCLRNVQISVPSTNGSRFLVPVMFMQSGTTTTMAILYLLSSETLGHTRPIENVTASDVPIALSVPSGRVSDQVTFSDASVVSANKTVIIYDYTVTALDGSNGYYAILPPYYYGAYPALAVGADPDLLNVSALSTWGFSGPMQSAEFALPSSIVGTGDLVLVNASVPMIPTCLNPACVIISHSGY
ncbi:MAG: hypothetical protein OK474_06670 [Thaumarchaeota archaeon]|nr:hypothetical protein [Nitrososphaerota archaeon]